MRERYTTWQIFLQASFRISLKTVNTLVQALGDGTSSGVGVRTERDEDRDFCAALYASVRSVEMEAVAWSNELKAAFLLSQYELQRDHYHTHYVGAYFLIIESDNLAIGRIYVHLTETELRLMDIALVEPARGYGTGSRLIGRLVAFADATRRCVTLHVEPDNPAQRLYARMGFTLVEHRGPYDFLRRDPPISS